jgi:hypothetical protein
MTPRPPPPAPDEDLHEDPPNSHLLYDSVQLTPVPPSAPQVELHRLFSLLIAYKIKI